MKKSFILIIFLLVIPAVTAPTQDGLSPEEAERMIAQNIDIVKPGIKPGNFLYGIDKALESVQLSFAGQGIPKAKLHMLLAEERLAEVKVLIDENKASHVERTLNQYEENVDKALVEVEKARGIGQDVSEIVKQIEAATEKHIAVLELVRDKVPEQAQAALDRVLAKAREKQAARKPEEKKAGVDITGAVTAEELLQKQQELLAKEEELQEREEALKGKGLSVITGLTVEKREELLKQRMGILFLVLITGTWLYFYYVNKMKHIRSLQSRK